MEEERGKGGKEKGKEKSGTGEGEQVRIPADVGVFLFAEPFRAPPNVTVFFFRNISGTNTPSEMNTSFGCTYL